MSRLDDRCRGQGDRASTGPEVLRLLPRRRSWVLEAGLLLEHAGRGLLGDRREGPLGRVRQWQTTARTTTTGSRRGPRSRGDREPELRSPAMEAADALAPAPKRSVGRRLADLFHGRPASRWGPSRRPGRLAGHRLHRLARGSAGRRLLERRRAQRRI